MSSISPGDDDRHHVFTEAVESFFIDLRNGERGAEPLLYKEWRLGASILARA